MQTRRNKKQDYFYIDINISTIMKDLMRYSWVILSLSLSVAFLAYIAVWMRYQPKYQLQATYVVSSKGINNNTLTNLDSTQLKAQRYAMVLQSEALKKTVADELEISGTQVGIRASVVPETNLLILQIVSDSPELTSRIFKSVEKNYHDLSQYLTGNAILRQLVGPTVPTMPVNWPAARQTMIKILVVMLVLLLGVATIISCMKDTIRSGKDIERKLGVSSLGEIAHEKKMQFFDAEMLKARKAFGRKKKPEKAPGMKKEKGKESLLVTRPTISFWYVESVNTICRAVMNKMLKAGAKSVMITSLLENEGKSTVAANLALSMAKQGKKVVLVDLDLLQPAQYKIFDFIDSVPLSMKDVLYKGNGISKGIGEIPEYEISTFFNKEKFTDSSTEVLSNGCLEVIFRYLKSRYDYIIVDTPPMSVSGDTEVIAMYVDASLVVVKQHVALADNLNDMLDMLYSAPSSLLGCVVNDVRNGERRVNYRYGYGKYYGEYYSRKR